MLTVKPFRQSPAHCGPACLKMVLDYFGLEKSEAELAKLCRTSMKTGTKSDAILAAAKQLGFDGFLRDGATLADIRTFVHKKKVPVMVNWFSTDYGHYSVVVDIDAKHISLQDPELNDIRVMDLKIFQQVWFDYFGMGYPRDNNDFVVRRMIVIEPKKH